MTLQELRNVLCSWDKDAKQWQFSLIGAEGLDNIKFALESCKKSGIIGDFVETGVWQGGACIYARAVMNELKINGEVFACDSFKGLPKPSWSEDDGDIHYKADYLSVPVSKVEKNFETLEVPTENVTFVSGWFKDTMPILKDIFIKENRRISVLRLDGDMYESTMTVLNNLYSLVADGGFIIIDDYCLPKAAKATTDFREVKKIVSPLIKVNDCIYYWIK